MSVCICASCQCQPLCVCPLKVSPAVFVSQTGSGPQQTHSVLQCSSGMTGPVTLCKVCHTLFYLPHCLGRCPRPALCFRLMAKTFLWATAGSGISLPPSLHLTSISLFLCSLSFSLHPPSSHIHSEGRMMRSLSLSDCIDLQDWLIAQGCCPYTVCCWPSCRVTPRCGVNMEVKHTDHTRLHLIILSRLQCGRRHKMMWLASQQLCVLQFDCHFEKMKQNESTRHIGACVRVRTCVHEREQYHVYYRWRCLQQCPPCQYFCLRVLSLLPRQPAVMVT